MRDPVFRGHGLSDGRGRPVLLIPGFLAGDGSLGLMANWLKRAGYRPTRAGDPRQRGLLGRRARALEKRLELDRPGAGSARGGDRTEPRRQPREGAGLPPPDLVCGLVTLGSPHLDPLAIHPLVRLQVDALGRLGSLGAPGIFKRSCLDGDCCADFWARLAAPAARARRLRGGLLPQRRHRGLARLPGSGADQRVEIEASHVRHGRQPGRLARRGRRAWPASAAATRAAHPATPARSSASPPEAVPAVFGPLVDPAPGSPRPPGRAGPGGRGLPLRARRPRGGRARIPRRPPARGGVRDVDADVSAPARRRRASSPAHPGGLRRPTPAARGSATTRRVVAYDDAGGATRRACGGCCASWATPTRRCSTGG